MKVLLVCALLVSSAFAQESQEQKNEKLIVTGINEATKALAKVNLSCQGPADCVVVAWGSKACGGPQGWVVSSNKEPIHKVLQRVAKASAHAEDAYNKKWKVISDCSTQLPPVPSCVDNKCSAK